MELVSYFESQLVGDTLGNIESSNYVKFKVIFISLKDNHQFEFKLLSNYAIFHQDAI